MFCPNCGTKCEDGACFCANCGTQLANVNADSATSDTTTQTTVTTEEKSTQEATTQEATTQEATTQEATTQEATTQEATTQEATTQEATAQGTAAQSEQPSAPVYMPMPAKKKFPVGAIVAIVAVFILIVGGVSGFCILKSITNPKNIVTKYAKALTSHNASALYDSLDFPENKFLTKELFEKSLGEDNTFDFGDAVDYNIIDPISDSLGSSSESSKKTYTLELRDSANAFSDSQTITLTKLGTKSFLFFDNWKIQTDNFLVKDASIAIPAGSKATLDGIELTSDMLNTHAGSTNGTYDIYTIKYMFSSKHTLKVISDNFEDFEQTVTPHAGNYSGTQILSVSTSDLTLSQNVATTLGETSKTLFTNLYTCAIAKKAYNDVVAGVDVLPNSASDLENGYNSIVSSYINGDSPLTAVTVNSATPAAQITYSDDDSLAVRVTLSVSYKADSVIKDFFSKKKQKKTYDGNEDYSFIYHYVDGKWQLYDSSAFDYCISYARY